MLPTGVCVTWIKEEVERIIRSHGSPRRRRMRASPSEPTSRLQRSSQGLLGLILEQSIESLNQVIRWAALDDFTDLVGKANGHKLRKGRFANVESHEDSYWGLVQEHFCRLFSAAHALVDCGVVLRVVFLQDCGQSRGRLRMRPWR